MTVGLRAAASDRTAEGQTHLKLKHQYLDELRQGLTTEKPRAWPRGIRWIIEHTEAHPVAVHRPDAHRTWVWSDLHLRHANTIKHCNRPFADAREMDRALMAAWTSAVGPGDTVVNGGDVALPGTLGGDVPGRGPGGTWAQAASRGQPRLQPAVRPARRRGPRRVDRGPRHRGGPAGRHDARPAGRRAARQGERPRPRAQPRTARQHAHINVCVEHTDYRPLRLEKLVGLAKRLVAGNVPGGVTTAERIRSAEAPTLERTVVGDGS